MSDSASPALSTPVSTRPTIPEVFKSLTTSVGQEGDPFPILDRVWDLYAGKGIRTVFLTVGASKSALADLEIAESLGCPLNIVTINDTEKAKWSEILTILKERKRDSEATSFSAGVESKWILPKNIRVQDAVPWWENGTMDISGTTLRTQNIGDFMASIAAGMKLKDNANRIDILKIDTTASAPGLERGLLASVLSSGYRPCIILVNWSKMPDVDLSTTLAAGHLQNSGYILLGKIGSKFLYYFTDEDLYQICSWEGIVQNNPIVTEIVSASKTPRSYTQ